MDADTHEIRKLARQAKGARILARTSPSIDAAIRLQAAEAEHRAAVVASLSVINGRACDATATQ
jgi:hypothetical protein